MLIRSAPGTANPLPQLHRRVRWIVGVVALAFLVLIGRLWQLQVVRGERYHERVLSIVGSAQLIPAVRGKILDRKGRELVDNRPAFNIYATPRDLDDGQLAELVRLLELDDEELRFVRERVAAGRARAPREPVLILGDQGRDRASLIQQARLHLPAIVVRDEPYRRYVHGDLAAHALGYMNHPTQAELADAEAKLGPDDFVGRHGLEAQWERYLRGDKGIERFVVDATGQRVEHGDESLLDGPRFVAPKPGHNLVVTLDLQLQQIAEHAVRRHAAAAVVVVEVDTGRILAMVSKPSFDPNVMTGHLTTAEDALLRSDPRQPYLDKATRLHYPPGSTFKFVTMLAALEDGVVTGETELECKGWHRRGNRSFRCSGGAHKHVDVVSAIKHSCNVYVWQLAELVTLDRLAEIAGDFGFGATTGLGLNGEVRGRMPTRDWYATQHRTFKIGYTLNAATGQGDVEVTVLQLAMAYAAIANGGALYVPQLVRRMETASGAVVMEYAPKLRRRVNIRPEHLEIMRRGMWAVVNEVGGTAHDADSELLAFAGKTGTAQARSGRRRADDEALPDGWHPARDHAWFAGFAPADRPEIAVVVLIEHGGRGGAIAGPVAREVIEGWWKLRNGHSIAPEELQP